MTHNPLCQQQMVLLTNQIMVESVFTTVKTSPDYPWKRDQEDRVILRAKASDLGSERRLSMRASAFQCQDRSKLFSRHAFSRYSNALSFSSRLAYTVAIK